jgi:sugar O-acyltransferase (sialic acid O-acetyltransferase NeuD family)
VKKHLIIIGAGRFGREVHTWAEQAILQGWPFAIRGFLDDRADILDGYDHYARVLSSVDAHSPNPDEVFLCAVGEPEAKRQYCGQLLERGGEFTTLVHPTALVGPTVRIGAGSIICPFTQLSCDIEIGRFVTLGTFSSVGHDSRIGDHCQISGHCGINGRAVIEEGAFLGSHAVILPNARVEAGAYVGAGSVVLKRVKANTKVFGNPAVQIG